MARRIRTKGLRSMKAAQSLVYTQTFRDVSISVITFMNEILGFSDEPAAVDVFLSTGGKLPRIAVDGTAAKDEARGFTGDNSKETGNETSGSTTRGGVDGFESATGPQPSKDKQPLEPVAVVCGDVKSIEETTNPQHISSSVQISSNLATDSSLVPNTQDKTELSSIEGTSLKNSNGNPESNNSPRMDQKKTNTKQSKKENSKGDLNKKQHDAWQTNNSQEATKQKEKKQSLPPRGLVAYFKWLCTKEAWFPEPSSTPITPTESASFDNQLENENASPSQINEKKSFNEAKDKDAAESHKGSASVNEESVHNRNSGNKLEDAVKNDAHVNKPASTNDEESRESTSISKEGDDKTLQKSHDVKPEKVNEATENRGKSESRTTNQPKAPAEEKASNSPKMDKKTAEAAKANPLDKESSSNSAIPLAMLASGVSAETRVSSSSKKGQPKLTAKESSVSGSSETRPMKPNKDDKTNASTLAGQAASNNDQKSNNEPEDDKSATTHNSTPQQMNSLASGAVEGKKSGTKTSARASPENDQSRTSSGSLTPKSLLKEKEEKKKGSSQSFSLTPSEESNTADEQPPECLPQRSSSSHSGALDSQRNYCDVFKEYLHRNNDKELVTLFGVEACHIKNMLQKLGDSLKQPELNLAMFLRFITHGKTSQELNKEFQISEGQILKAILTTAKKLKKAMSEELNETRWAQAATSFKTKFNYPRAVGVLGVGQIYLKKETPALLLVVIDGDLRVLTFSFGNLNDDQSIVLSGLLHNILMDAEKRHFPRPEPLSTSKGAKVDYAVLADHQFSNKLYLMQPYSVSEAQEDSAKKVFNDHFTELWRVLPLFFKHFVKQFPVFKRGLPQLEIDDAKIVLEASLIIWNLISPRVQEERGSTTTATKPVIKEVVDKNNARDLLKDFFSPVKKGVARF